MEVVFEVYITDTETGETRVQVEPYEWDDRFEYLWGDGGNFSCDCNRSLFFTRAGDEEEIDIHCGMERYIIEVKVDGEPVYTEVEQK